MDRTVSISINHREAREHDIRQHQEMTHEQRQAAARELRIRYFGSDRPDVRDSTKNR